MDSLPSWSLLGIWESLSKGFQIETNREIIPKANESTWNYEADLDRQIVMNDVLRLN